MDNHSLEFELLEIARNHPRRQLKDAYGGFIAQWPWQWFVTLTFSTDPHPEKALKLFYLWASKMNRALYGRRWNKVQPFGVSWVVATEPHKSGRVHLHALVAGVEETRRLTWMDKWSGLSRQTGWARIVPVDNQTAVSRYVTKYVAKGGDLFFSENLGIESWRQSNLPFQAKSDA